VQQSVCAHQIIVVSDLYADNRYLYSPYLLLKQLIAGRFDLRDVP